MSNEQIFLNIIAKVANTRIEMQPTDKVKSRGSVYTPPMIVHNMLDLGRYYGSEILNKHIIDNSCGDGAFLQEIVKRYCEEFLKSSQDRTQLSKDLTNYIHGIEIDCIEHQKCIDNLNILTSQFGLDSNICWDIVNADTLTLDKYNNQMDFVFGNPPYVRVHNLGDNQANTRSFEFAQKGMTDLYIVFFEIGFSMLNQNGKLCLITPSSWLTSKAGSVLREYISLKNNLIALVDLEHFQAFNATTYSLISLFTKEQRQDSFQYFTFDKDCLSNRFICNLRIDQIRINQEFYLGTPAQLSILTEILYSEQIAKKYVEVKNGFATLADDVYITENDFFYSIDVIKASTGKWSKCIFPYNLTGHALHWETIKSNDSDLANYLLDNKERLSSRSLDSSTEWFLFGRSQAIRDVSKPKIAINCLIKDLNSIKISTIDIGQGVYGGLYILTDQASERIFSLLKCANFVSYIKMLKKYKSGGYYTFNSKDVERYLNYHLSKSKNSKIYDQPRYSQTSLQFI